MALQRVVKIHPLLRGALLVSLVLAILAITLSGIATRPDDANIGLFVGLVGLAVALPFLSLLVKKREVVTYELPSDRLRGASKEDLEGMLDALDAARERGELSPQRYTKARERIEAALADG